MNKKQVFASMAIGSMMAFSMVFPVSASSGSSNSSSDSNDTETEVEVEHKKDRKGIRACAKMAQVNSKVELKTAKLAFKTTELEAMKAWKQAMLDSKSMEQGSTERKEFLKAAEQTFRDTMKEAKETLKLAKKDSKETLKDSKKSCRAVK